MSYSAQMQTMAGQPEQQVQQQLQSLVQQMPAWSYVALWSLNPQTRNLGWKGGHWRQSDSEVWSERFFKSTYKSCQFRTSFRSVGVAHAEGRNIWMNDTKITDNAGSKEQAEFLRRAGISTAMYIPWSDGVLELGTSENLPKDQHLMERIRDYFTIHIMPTLGLQQQQQQPSGHSQLSATMQAAGLVNSQAPGSSFPARSMMQQPANYSSLSPLRHLSDVSNTQSFEPNSLNQQLIRRSASMSAMDPDMFLQDAATEGKEVGNNEVDQETNNMLLGPANTRAWGLPTVNPTRAAASMLQTPDSAPLHQVYYPPVQQRTRGQYRSRSGTTSSSVSSLEEAASTRLTVDSPEHNSMFIMNPSQRQTSHSNTSSSSRRGASSHSPEMDQLEDALRKTGTPSLQETHESRVEEEIQLDAAISLMLADGESLESQEQWRNIYSPSLETGNMSPMNLVDTSATNGNHNDDNHGNSFNGTHVVRNELQQQGQPISPSQSQRPFKSWRHARVLAPVLQKSNNRKNQELLRRCIDMMKQIPHSSNAQRIQNSEGQAVIHNVGQQGPRVASSSSPETVNDIGMAHDPFDQDLPRMQRRPRGGSRIATMGAVHSGHDEAAMNHMMAERRRRVKQKENFAALRRLVPIISKADKASILGDAIVYLKDLQSQIEGLEASRAEAETRYENLEKLHQDLEQRNKELESMVRSTRLHHHSL